MDGEFASALEIGGPFTISSNPGCCTLSSGMEDILQSPHLGIEFAPSLPT
jgi:hypothetical protein